LKPVVGGGIPPHHTFIELKMTFKEGGAFDFASTYERVKETLSQALEMARESGRPSAADLSEVNLEQLPAYEEATGAPTLQRPTPISRTAAPPTQPRDSGIAAPSDNEQGTTSLSADLSNGHPHPTEPPPGYEETQQNSIAESLERGIRKGESVQL